MSSSPSEIPIVQVITPEAATPDPSFSPSPAARKLARGFTITISGPQDSNRHSSSGFEFESKSSLSPRHDSSHLAPEENVAEVSLDRTESRLPSLEDMLADEQIRQMLETTATHAEVQQAILAPDNSLRYDKLMALVQKSFESVAWRREAAADKGLIDTLVLFCRQKLTEADSPLQPQGADFLGRSTRTLKTLDSKKFSRSNTNSSVDSAGSSCSAQNKVAAETLVKSATALSLIGPTIKLLRNLLAGGEECKLYLFEHHLVDLLLGHVDLIIEISQAVEQESLDQSGVDLVIPEPRCPSWVICELERFPRSLVQLVTNAVAGNELIQSETLANLFPEQIFKLVILSGDADLICCLLHSLTAQLPSEYSFPYLIDSTSASRIWYLLMSAALRQAHPDLKSVAFKRQARSMEGKSTLSSPSKSPPNSSSKSLPGEWVSIFVSAYMKSHNAGQSAFVEVARMLGEADLHAIRAAAVSANVLSQARSRSRSLSRRGSFESRDDPDEHLSRRLDQVLVDTTGDVLSFFYSVVDATLENDLELMHSLLTSPAVPSSLIKQLDQTNKSLFTIQAEAVEQSQALRVSFKAFTSLLASLSVGVHRLSVEERALFDETTGPAVLLLVTDILQKFKKLKQEKNEIMWIQSRPYICRRDLILVIANLCFKSKCLQETFAGIDGIALLLEHGHMDADDFLMEEAATYALRNVCQGENRKILQDLLDSRFKGARPNSELSNETVVAVDRKENQTKLKPCP